MRSSRPKVLHRVGGVPIIKHVVSAANSVQPASTVVVVSPDNAAQVTEELGEDFDYAEQPEPLGTGHALSVALERVPFNTGHVILLNGDMPLIRGDDVLALAERHRTRNASVTVMTTMVPAERAHDLGSLERGARGKPIGIVEAAERPAGQPGTNVEVVVGAYAFNSAWVRKAVVDLPKHGDEYYVTDLIARAVAEGRRVESIACDSLKDAIGVNTRTQLAEAERAMQRRLRQQALDDGVTLVDPDAVYLDSTVELSPDVVIHPNTTISGRSIIKSGAELGPNARIIDSVIGEGAIVDQAVIRSSTVSERAHVGPFSLLRDGSLIEPDAYIGAHAEIKASTIGSGTHVGHFSYVGDAILGANVNIGAGTVTCNYDGVAKHRTDIGDGAFIGSGSMLVAPVKIGSGALTGAGAVVTQDVAPGERVAGVPARAIAARQAAGAIRNEGGSALG